MNGLDFLGYALGSFIWLIIGIIVLIILIIASAFIIAIIMDILEKRKQDKLYREFEKRADESRKRILEMYKEFDKNEWNE